jgi:hypothetical protein
LPVFELLQFRYRPKIEKVGPLLKEYEVKKSETTTGRTPAETQIETAGDQRAQEITHPPITREYVHSIRGKLKGKGLLKALMDDRKNPPRVRRD